MIKLLREYIYIHSTGKTVISLLILTNLIYFFMLLVSIPKVMAFAGGMKLPDMMPAGYDAEYIKSLFDALGKNGRSTYLYNQIPPDMFYPGFFGVTYCFLFIWFLKKINRHQSSLFYFSFLPIIAGISDYIENIGIITLLKQYPDILSETVSFTNAFSMFKSANTTVYFLALIVIIAWYFVHYIKNKKEGSIAE